MTPKQAHKRVLRLARKKKQSLRAFCAEAGVSHSTVSKWASKDGGSVYDTILDRLIGKRK